MSDRQLALTYLYSRPSLIGCFWLDWRVPGEQRGHLLPSLADWGRYLRATA